MFYIVMDEITKCTFYMCHESWLANVKKNHILLYVTKYALFSILCNAGILFGMLKSAYFGHNGNTLKGLLLNGPSIPVFCGQFYDVPEVYYIQVY